MPLSPSLSLSPVAEGGGETGSQRSDATRSDTEIAEMRRGCVRNQRLGIGEKGLGIRVEGFGLRVQGLGFGVKSLGLGGWG